MFYLPFPFKCRESGPIAWANNWTTAIVCFVVGKLLQISPFSQNVRFGANWQ